MWKTVMIDDEPWALEGLAEIIDWQAAGFSIQGRFTDPQEAFAFLCESWPDVVFTDIRMPGLSGVDLISMARQKGIDCEFVLISAYEDFKAAQQAILLDVCGYVLKPYDSEEIHKVAEILQRHLEKRRGAPQLDWRSLPGGRPPPGRRSFPVIPAAFSACMKSRTNGCGLGREWSGCRCPLRGRAVGFWCSPMTPARPAPPFWTSPAARAGA